MTAYVYNLMLAAVWAALTGSFSLTNLVIGFVLGYVVLSFALSRDERFANYGAKLPQALSFSAYFLWALLRSNLRVAYDVLTPTHLMRPAVIRVPLEAHTPGEITVLANLISLTPGTLSLDVDEDQSALYIHVMYLDDEAETVAEIKDLERRVLELMR